MVVAMVAAMVLCHGMAMVAVMGKRSDNDDDSDSDGRAK